MLTAKWTSAPLGKERSGLGCQALGLRQAIEAILVDCVADALGEVGLELRRGHGQSVEEQHEVDAVRIVERVAHLPDDAQPIRSVAGEDVRIDGERGLELG